MEQELLCPKCGSSHLTADKKGFSGKKAVAGALLTGGVGLLAGTIGSNKIKITCLSCGHKFSPGQGANSKEDFAVKKEQDRKAGKVAFIIVGIIALIIILNNMFGGDKNTKSSDANKSNAVTTSATTTAATIAQPTERANYEVIETGQNGNISKILIDPKMKNAKDLKMLGATLDYDTRDEQIVIIMIFDNAKAAALNDKAAEISDAQYKFLDKHTIGGFYRNPNSGFHQMTISMPLKDEEGKPLEEIKY